MSGEKLKRLVIWWTNQADCEAIGQSVGCPLPESFPDYLRDQFDSRWGRNGRGRLWVASQFGDVSVSPWPATALGVVLGERPILGQTYAGIVIRVKDTHFLDDMPGVLTDLQLRRLAQRSEEP